MPGSKQPELQEALVHEQIYKGKQVLRQRNGVLRDKASSD